MKKEIDKMKISLAADQEMDKQLEKRLGAWEYYKRAREIKRQLQLSEQVKLFPSNGKEQWGHLVSRMKLIREQQEVLQPKIDEYRLEGERGNYSVDGNGTGTGRSLCRFGAVETDCS